MAAKEKSTPQNALLLFVDIIDSSTNSKYLGLGQFADNVIKFQDLFTKLGKTYFFNKEEYIECINFWCNVNSRGDEGLIFIIDKNIKKETLIINAVKFLFELKARINSIFYSDNGTDPPPKTMKIAAGIHYGPVIPLTIFDKGRKRISEIIGYNINYAKRIESESRSGSYSNIFLSLEAANIILRMPVFLSKRTGDLKGIENNEILFEVQCALFKDPLVKLSDNPLFCRDKEFNEFFRLSDFSLEKYVNDNLKNNIFLIREPWLRGFFASYLLQKYDSIGLPGNKEKILDAFNKFIWNDQFDQDPSIIFIRAIQCEKNKKLTRAIIYYKNIISNHPNFKLAQTNLIRSCFEILNNKKKITSEIIYVRDIAEELLVKYDAILETNEKDLLNKIVIEFSAKE